jgi:hypothetical protein
VRLEGLGQWKNPMTSSGVRIRSTEKKSNDLIRNRTRDLPACSIVPQPTMLRRALDIYGRKQGTYEYEQLHETDEISRSILKECYASNFMIEPKQVQNRTSTSENRINWDKQK